MGLRIFIHSGLQASPCARNGNRNRRLPKGLSPLTMIDPIRIQDLAVRERPRERLAEQGAESLRNAELLAILLRTGVQGASAVQVGEQLLQHFGTLDGLARAPLEQLRVRGVGRDKAIALKAAFTLARRMADDLRRDLPLMERPEAIVAVMRDEMITYETEHLKVLLLNSRRKLIRVETVAAGLLDQILVHAREVFRPAIAANAHSIVLVHNHPSGDPVPSEADTRATRDLVRAGQLLRIPVVDHVIIGRRSESFPDGWISLRQMGVVPAE